MEEGKYIQTMFVCFQTILNELHFLNRHYDNYDHIDKILGSLSRKWRPWVQKKNSIMMTLMKKNDELPKI